MSQITLIITKNSYGGSKLNLQARWSEVKEQLKENNIELTDEDLEYEPGKENELLERLQEKMKRSKRRNSNY